MLHYLLQKQERDSKLNYIINKRKICCTIAATLDQILLPDSAFEPFYCTPFLVLWPVFPGSLMACTTSFRCSLCLQSQTANRVENNCRTDSVHATEILWMYKIWILSLCDSATESESSRRCFLWPHHFGGNIREIHGLAPGIKSQNSNFI